MCSGFIYVVANVQISFFLKAETYSILNIYHVWARVFSDSTSEVQEKNAKIDFTFLLETSRG
jgi:hypothetical protein